MTAQKYVRTSLLKENGQDDYVNCPGVMLPSASPQKNIDHGGDAIKNTVIEHGAQMCPETNQFDSKGEKSAEAIRLETDVEKSKPLTKDRSMVKPSGDVSTETTELENGKRISDGTIRLKDYGSNQLKMLILPTDLFSVKLKHVIPTVTSGCKPHNNNLGKTNSSETVTKFSQNVKKRSKKAPVSIPTDQCLLKLKSGGKMPAETGQFDGKFSACIGKYDTTQAGRRKPNNNETSDATVELEAATKSPEKLPVPRGQFSQKPKVPPPIIPRATIRIARVSTSNKQSTAPKQKTWCSVRNPTDPSSVSITSSLPSDQNESNATF